MYQRRLGRTVSDSVRTGNENGVYEIKTPKREPLSKIPQRTGSKIPIPEQKFKDDEGKNEEQPTENDKEDGKERREASSEEERLEDFLLRGKLSSLDRVKKYLEELNRSTEEEVMLGASRHLPILTHRSPLRTYSIDYDKDSRPRSFYVPDYSPHTSDFDRYLDFKKSFPDRGYGSLRRPRAGTSGDRYIPLRRATSLSREEKREEPKREEGPPKTPVPDVPEEPPQENPPQPKEEARPETPPGKSVLHKYLYGEKTRKPSRFLRPDFYTNPPEEIPAPAPPSKEKQPQASRIDKAIKSLRKNSIGQSDGFSESKLLKRAVSLEDLDKDPGPSRNRRASSLKPEGSEKDEKIYRKKVKTTKKGGMFDSIKNKVANNTEEQPKPQTEERKIKAEARQARIANLKKLDFAKAEPSAESTPTGECDEVVSQTDNSDTWSSSDYAEGRFDPSTEECVSDRIRRKSFYTRFNQASPSRAYNRSLSTSGAYDRKRYF